MHRGHPGHALLVGPFAFQLYGGVQQTAGHSSGIASLAYTRWSRASAIVVLKDEGQSVPLRLAVLLYGS